MVTAYCHTDSTILVQLWNQYNFSVGAGLEHFFVRARRIGERQLLPDLRLVSAALHSRDNRGMRRGELGRQRVPVREADNRRVLPHDRAGIQFERAAIADDGDAAALGDQVEILHEIDVREHLDDQDRRRARRSSPGCPSRNRHAEWSNTSCAPCSRASCLPRSVPAVPKTRNPAALAICTAATPTAPLAPWIRTVSPGTARPLSKSARQAVTYGTPTPAPSANVTRGRKLMNLIDRAHRALRVRAVRAAVDGAADVDTIARLEVVHVAAHRCNDAGRIGPGRIRQRRQRRVLSAADVRVDRIDAGGFHVDEHLSRAWQRVSGTSSSFITDGSPN